MVVVGGRHSNNTRELKASSELFGARSIQIETVKELRSEWFEGVETVGVTGGTSTPDSDLEEVFAWLEQEARGRENTGRSGDNEGWTERRAGSGSDREPVAIGS